MNTRFAAQLISVSLIACGGGGGSKNPPTPDASSPSIDAPSPDAARSCTGVTAGMLDFNGGNADVVSWLGPVTGDLGDGNRLVYKFEFYSGIESILSGTIDLHTGNQSNYKTCAVCVRAFALDAQDQVQKQFFQSGGSITLTEDPFTNQHVIASLSGLQLEEVTVDDNDYTSTPVANGACMSFGNYNVDHDRVPNAWTCQHSDYADGTNCNCMCGFSDPDCSTETNPVMGCTVAGQACVDAACVTPPMNDTCQTAQPITLPLAAPINGTTAAAHKNYNAGLEGTTCTGVAQRGSDVAYSIALTANQQITVTLSNVGANFDAGIALVGPDSGTPGSVCDANPITTCVKGADENLEGMNETFTYTATTAGTYFIIVDSYYTDQAGTYTLNVTSP
jgi:hypothetical protein